MTDTSREAVERLLDGVTPGPWMADDEDQGSECGTAWSVIDVEQAFMAAVWDALKADAGDLRKQQRILAAFRDAVHALLARAEAAEAERDALKAGQTDAIRAALEAAAKCCDDKADRWDAAIKWGRESARFNQDCIATVYGMRDCSSSIRAIDPAAIAAKLKGYENE